MARRVHVSASSFRSVNGPLIDFNRSPVFAPGFLYLMYLGSKFKMPNYALLLAIEEVGYPFVLKQKGIDVVCRFQLDP